MRADELNRLLPMPPHTWALDALPYHARLAGLGDAHYTVALTGMGPAYTLIHHGKIVALWGIVMPWAGLAEAWLVCDAERLRPLSRALARGATCYLGLAVEAHALKRLQIHVKSANVTNAKFARLIGFQDEARLPGFLPGGEEAILMAWRG